MTAPIFSAHRREVLFSALTVGFHHHHQLDFSFAAACGSKIYTSPCPARMSQVRPDRSRLFDVAITGPGAR